MIVGRCRNVAFTKLKFRNAYKLKVRRANYVFRIIQRAAFRRKLKDGGLQSVGHYVREIVPNVDHTIRRFRYLWD